ncbi:hypothetical protein [Cryptosporangium sp. NPDC051539]|uniref:hypothetical protein n=1 Tax=Cryptosporangium sp. NPDC051539 TaxID=3363962 RepID=UPI00379D9FC6
MKWNSRGTRAAAGVAVLLVVLGGFALFALPRDRTSSSSPPMLVLTCCRGGDVAEFGRLARVPLVDVSPDLGFVGGRTYDVLVSRVAVGVKPAGLSDVGWEGGRELPDVPESCELVLVLVRYGGGDSRPTASALQFQVQVDAPGGDRSGRQIVHTPVDLFDTSRPDSPAGVVLAVVTPRNGYVALGSTSSGQPGVDLRTGGQRAINDPTPEDLVRPTCR